MRLLAAILALMVAPAPAVTLKRAAQNDILTLDPHSQNHATTHAIVQYAYEGLVRYNAKYEIDPCLAVSWTKSDDLHYRVNVRKTVLFHDGSVLSLDVVGF